ncbi:hypothetical protein HYH02_005471 [Chlamydomonas schloesseri]|uniref:Uncharacterized protein n=1 Tax=Chlamydomonas schloesseri TaxID=2026947 RepID=A0A836B6R4_9CHLO|nr:hypothetical protein HYH02_005471 [Chlamydomonas schloesseri]|eukprot:KAG2449316.1 hypothetical protein HYH02_005471 [Chlamydomonas schloesseri]
MAMLMKHLTSLEGRQPGELAAEAQDDEVLVISSQEFRHALDAATGGGRVAGGSDAGSAAPPAPGTRATVAAAARAASTIAADGNEAEEDVMVTGMVGQVVTLDFPHPRSDCAGHPFSRTAGGVAAANASRCPQCFCYVCDVRASECTFWGTGLSPHDHANAHAGYRQWTRLRHSVKNLPTALRRAQLEAAAAGRVPWVPVAATAGAPPAAPAPAAGPGAAGSGSGILMSAQSLALQQQQQQQQAAPRPPAQQALAAGQPAAGSTVGSPLAGAAAAVASAAARAAGRAPASPPPAVPPPPAALPPALAALALAPVAAAAPRGDWVIDQAGSGGTTTAFGVAVQVAAVIEDVLGEDPTAPGAHARQQQSRHVDPSLLRALLAELDSFPAVDREAHRQELLMQLIHARLPRQPPPTPPVLAQRRVQMKLQVMRLARDQQLLLLTELLARLPSNEQHDLLIRLVRENMQLQQQRQQQIMYEVYEQWMRPQQLLQQMHGQQQ